MVLEKVDDLRYGENPHQRARCTARRRTAAGRSPTRPSSRAAGRRSTTCSTSTPRTASRATTRRPTVAIAKHTDPVGLASARRARRGVPARARDRPGRLVRRDRRREPRARRRDGPRDRRELVRGGDRARLQPGRRSASCAARPASRSWPSRPTRPRACATTASPTSTSSGSAAACSWRRLDDLGLDGSQLQVVTAAPPDARGADRPAVRVARRAARPLQRHRPRQERRDGRHRRRARRAARSRSRSRSAAPATGPARRHGSRRLLPVPRRHPARGAGRRHRDHPARRLDPRRDGHRGGRPTPSGDGLHRPPPLPTAEPSRPSWRTRAREHARCRTASRPRELPMEKLLALEMVRVTEAAAIASARLMGRGDRTEADRPPPRRCAGRWTRSRSRATIVIGEGERDEAPMLYIGEQRRATATEADRRPERRHRGRPAGGHQPRRHRLGERDHGPRRLGDAAGSSTRRTPTSRSCASARSRPARSTSACPPAENVRRDRRGPRPDDQATSPSSSSTARATTTSSPRSGPPAPGSSSSATATCRPRSAAPCPGTGVHAVMGIGGAPEGVITAAALRCLGGEIQARFRYRNDEERERGARMGHGDEDRSTAPRTSRRASTSSSRRPASRPATCSRACGSSAAARGPTRW